MTVQIDQIFTAKAESIQAFLSTAGQGCYIPAYQRPYAWDKGNVDRLFEDVINGLNHMLSRPDTISFLGTLIAIHDTKFTTVSPVYKSEVPPRVMTIIDGQQRISTSAMISIALHAQIRALLRRLCNGDGEEFQWIREQAEQALVELWQSFVLEQAVGTPRVYRHYPRVIRAMEDVWSKRQNQAVYRSPISALIWAYVRHVDQPAEEERDFKHQFKTVDGKDDPTHQPLIDVFDYIGGQIRGLIKFPEKHDFPDVKQLISNPKYIEALWSFPAPDAVVKFTTEGSDKRLFRHYVQLLRTLILFKYFCTRVALTVVTTRTEDDAFDMFEALNTTGEPLTAYETFRPKVIEAETLEQFEHSPSHQGLTRIDRHLGAFKKADERQRATAEMLIPFALAETGDKLPKNLSDQRRYLRDTFDKLQTIDEKRDAVISMANLAIFMETGWTLPLDEAPRIEGITTFDDTTGFAFQALRNLKHNVVIAAISRFYDELRRASPEEMSARASDFADAIKATTAFTMLWRGAKGGTENIDTLYRTIMREGDPQASIPPLAKRVEGTVRGVPVLTNYRRLLWHRLVKEFPTRKEWVKAASRVPIYRHSTVVAKFLLICASHDTAPDARHPGLIERGRAGLASTMRTDVWRNDTMFTVEHVAPQAQSNGWDPAIYEPGQEAFNRLGNLTLLPRAANEYVSNRTWAHKRLLYRFFSAATDAEAEAVRAEFQPAGLAVSVTGDSILANSPYMPMCRSIAAHPADWTVDTIDRRSTRLAELAYDNLVVWLSPDTPAVP
ncbi:MAG: DUF262 domain-containing HNH endonuclease family protein [Sphingomonadaceae bacterium]